MQIWVYLNYNNPLPFFRGYLGILIFYYAVILIYNKSFKNQIFKPILNVKHARHTIALLRMYFRPSRTDILQRNFKIFKKIFRNENDECRQGLVEEQIACLNVYSYTCQFIQPIYKFRLVPTRLIVQEARIAEDGADKCHKIVRKYKKSKNNL